MAPAIDAAEHGAFGDRRRARASRAGPTPAGRPAARRRRCRPPSSWCGRAGLSGRAVLAPSGIFRIGRHRVLLDELLDPQRGDLAAAAAAGGKGGEQKGAVADVDEAVAGAGLEQGGQNVGGHRLLALAAARPGAGAHRQLDRALQARRVEFSAQDRAIWSASTSSTAAGAPCWARAARRLRNRPCAFSVAATSAGMPCAGSVSRLAGSHRWCATNLISSASGAGQGRGLSGRGRRTRPRDSRDRRPAPAANFRRCLPWPDGAASRRRRR